MQYLAYIYHYVKEWRKDPKWSFSCCLALLLPLNQLQGEIRGLAERNVLNQQLQTGKMEMPSIASTLRDSGAVDITLEEHNAEGDQEEETENEISMIEQGLLTLAKVSVHELPRGTYAREEHNAEGEQEEETENEISMIERGLLTLAKVSVHELPRGTYALEELNAEREQEEETENEVSMIEQGFLTVAKVSDHEPPMVIYETTV